VNINKLKPYPYLGPAPKKVEATIEREGEHKEDSKYKEDSNVRTQEKMFMMFLLKI
jgi:hypothetical protein